MGELENYKLNCDYMRERFSLPESTNLYAMVNKIVDSYKELLDLQEIAKYKDEANNDLNRINTSTEVEQSHKEKKRGRPRKA